MYEPEGYIANCDTWCSECAKERGWTEAGAVDSDGENVRALFGWDETETPDHCAACGTLLSTTLTSYGEQYVAEAFAEHLGSGGGTRSVLIEWAHEYSYLPNSAAFLKAVKA